MPIYGFGTIGAPWEKINNINKSSLKSYRLKLSKAIKKFKYSNDEVFLQSIKLNYIPNTDYIASYDYSRTNMPSGQYIKYMEELLTVANESLGPYSDKKYDIQGNWIMGHIIIMRKNNQWK